MSSQRPPALRPDTVPIRALSGALWVAGGLLFALALGLLAGVAAALLACAAWCMATAALVGRRR